MSSRSFVKSSNTCLMFIFTSHHLAMPRNLIWYNSHCFIVRSSGLVDFTLFCGKISFIAIYAVLSQNMFCPDLRTFYVEKNCAQNFVRVGKMTNIMYVYNYESSEKHFPWNIIWRPMAIFFAILEMPCNQIAPFLLHLHMAYRIAHNAKYRMHTRHCISIIHSVYFRNTLVPCNAIYGTKSSGKLEKKLFSSLLAFAHNMQRLTQFYKVL